MDEKNIAEEKSASNNEVRVQPEEFDKIGRAEFAVKRMEDAEKRLDEKIAKLTELEANRILGGTAGGHIETMKTPEQLMQEKVRKDAEEIVKAFR